MYAVLLESDGDALVDVCGEVEDLICTLGTESTVWLGLLPRLRKLTVLVVAEGVRGAASNFIRSCALADILRARSVNQPELVKINLWFSEDCYEAVDRNALYELVCLGSECGVRMQYDVFTCEHEELMDTWMTV
ncbi:hypothetical protein BD626DRAFT_499904 [Schizophyllum amplum]|uniref:Uncharacterized protein n=1 Tax=Schizophyllum amplum TaxID=97359 RepID=A0A550CBB1_9AGAR|nr:hypothetical protein BD626DRAFT_499904 [Auriculariopsis ampla]